MKSEHVELIKELLQQEIDKDVKMFNEAGEVDWNFGRWYLASQLLTTIKMLEQKEHAEKPMKKINLNPVAEAKVIKDYCSGVICFGCVFDSDEGCVLNEVDSIPSEWNLPEEKEGEESL